MADALQKARKVYAEEHTHPANRAVVAKDLGYSGLSGSSATVIGALRQYGVLEGRGEDLRVSEDAVTAYELPESDPERIAALKRMAFKPELFEELRSQFPDRAPSEANLRHILIKKGFLSKQADEVIRAYRENFELVGGPSVDYTDEVKTTTSGVHGGDAQVAAALDSSAKREVQFFPKTQSAPVHSLMVFSWPLSKDIMAEVRLTGSGVKSSHLERLRQYLELAKDAVDSDESDAVK